MKYLKGKRYKTGSQISSRMNIKVSQETLTIGKINRVALLCELFKNVPTVSKKTPDKKLIWQLPHEEAAKILGKKDPIRIEELHGKYIGITFDHETLDFTDYLHREYEAFGFSRFRAQTVLDAVKAAEKLKKSAKIKPVSERKIDPLQKERDALIIRLRSLIFNRDEEITGENCTQGTISSEAYLGKAIKIAVPEVTPGAHITATHSLSWTIEGLLRKEANKYIENKIGWPRLEPADEFYAKFTRTLKDIEKSLPEYIHQYVMEKGPQTVR